MTQYDVGIKYEVDAAAIKQARKEINNTNKELDNSKKKAKDVGDSGKAGFGKMKVAAAAAAAAIVVVGTAALKAAAITRAEFAKINQINDIALFTGASLQGLADLEARSKLVGISVDQLTGVLIRQQEKLQEGNVIFDQLGLSLDRLNLVDPTQAFQEIINAINDTDDAALKARGITQLLGEGSVGALKLAGDLGTVEEQLNRLRASGAILTPQQLQDAAKMDEITNNINTSWDTIKRNAAIAFGPVTQGGLKIIANTLENINELDPLELATNEYKRALQELQTVALVGGQSDELLEPLRQRVVLTTELLDIQTQLNAEELRRSQALSGLRRNRDGDFRDPLAASAIIEQSEARIAAIQQERLAIVEDMNAEQLAYLTVKEEQLALETEQARLQREKEDRDAAALKTQEAITKELQKQVGISATNATSFLTERLRQELPEFELANSDAMADIESLIANMDRLRDSGDFNTAEDLFKVDPELFRLMEILQRVTGLKLLDPDMDLDTFNASLQTGMGLARDIRTELDVASQRAELNAMLERELEIGREIANGQITSSDQLSRRLELERELLDIREQFPDLAEEEVAARAKGILIAREANEELLKEMDDYRDFIDGLSRSFGNILGDSIIDSLESGRLEFDSFFSDIGKMLIRSGIQELIGQIFSPQQGGSGGGGSIFQLLLTGIISAFAGGSSGDGGGSGGGGASVGAGMRGGLAKGGVVNSTEMYGGYQISEQSPEAIMPLTRDSQGRLGVSASGGGSGGVTYNFSNVINVTGSDQPQETADKTAAALNQLIDRKIKAQMIDQRRAGNMLNTIPNRY